MSDESQGDRQMSKGGLSRWVGFGGWVGGIRWVGGRRSGGGWVDWWPDV